EAPLFLAARGDREVGELEARGALGPRGARDDGVGVRAVGDGARVIGDQSFGTGLCCGGHQPTDPSICSSMRRLSSSAYSMGSSREMGSTNPRTIMAMASVSGMPRDMR